MVAAIIRTRGRGPSQPVCFRASRVCAKTAPDSSVSQLPDAKRWRDADQKSLNGSNILNIGSEVSSDADAELLLEQTGALVQVTLNRPRAYNAINYVMRAALTEALPGISRDPETYAMVIRSASEKAFSAGADVREIIACAKSDIAAAREGFKAEYTLNWQLECFTKPTASLMDGMVIGSGVGITTYGTHRVAGEGYSFSMPETAIGLFPDVGVAYVLARLPDEIGIYMGLVGARIGRADAFDLGLVTHAISRTHFAEIIAELSDAQPIDPVLDTRHEDPGPRALEPLRETITHCFSASTVEEIVERLKAVTGANADWAKGVAADILTRSPASLKVTLAHLRRAKSMTLKDVLEMDYRLACRFLDGYDFGEGVRAALIDKDGKPAWQPATLEDVDDAMVESYFAPGDKAHDMTLPPREVAQAIKR